MGFLKLGLSFDVAHRPISSSKDMAEVFPL